MSEGNIKSAAPGLQALTGERLKILYAKSFFMEWIGKLPDKIQVSLESLLDRVENHEETYMEAQNASVGQIWVAMAMMNERVEKLEEIVSAQRKVLNNMEDTDVDKHIDRKLEESLKNY